MEEKNDGKHFSWRKNDGEVALLDKKNDRAKNFSQNKNDRADTFSGLNKYNSHKVYIKNISTELLVSNMTWGG